MDPGIENLTSTTFFGRRLTRRQIADVQETVALLPALSRNELAKTICEHLSWTTPKGDYRVSACLRTLESPGGAWDPDPASEAEHRIKTAPGNRAHRTV